MPDLFDSIYEELSKKLPRNDDRKLLRMLLDAQREGGKDAVKKIINMMLEEIAGE